MALAFYAIISIILRVSLQKYIGVIPATWLVVDGGTYASQVSQLADAYTHDTLSRDSVAPFFLLGKRLYLLQMRGLNRLHVLVIILVLEIMLLHGIESKLITMLLFTVLALAVSDRLASLFHHYYCRWEQYRIACTLCTGILATR